MIFENFYVFASYRIFDAYSAAVFTPFFITGCFMVVYFHQ